MSRDAFGPNLRRLRLQRRLTVEEIAAATRIPVELLHSLEQNDFENWPAGVFSRAYVRQYAEAVGADAEATVDEFCRWFPAGDRRVGRTVREHAVIVGHESEWHDEIPPEVGHDRRGLPPEPPSAQRRAHSAAESVFLRLRRALGRA